MNQTAVGGGGVQVLVELEQMSGEAWMFVRAYRAGGMENHGVQK